MRKSEERLRTLHPYAMARYDRLRGEGAGPLEAMREAAPLFSRAPYARPGQPGTKLRIEATPADTEAAPVAGVTDGSPRPPAQGQDPDREAEHRGQEIVRRMQARARAECGSELSPDELATVLEAMTNLPAEVIGRLARARSEDQVAAAAERARAADLHRADGARSDRERAHDFRAARRETRIADTAGAHASADRSAALLAAESFPCTAADGIRAAASGSLQQPSPSAVPVVAAQNVRRPGQSA